MAEIRTVHTARKPYDCQAEPCAVTIRPGDRYLLAALPPSDEGSPGHWLRMKVCQPCAERWGQSIDEQATPRRSTRARRPRTRPDQHRPARRHVDEPHLHRPIVDVHLPTADITA